MNEKFAKKYRVKSTRLKGFDYGQDGYYFITICTKDKKNYFGKIQDSEIFLSPIGKIDWKYWQEIPDHFPNTKLDEFVVMPNHIHGILIIDNWSNENQHKCRDTKFCVSTNTENKFEPQSKNLALIIRGFKVGVKKYSTLNKIPFVRQSRFYDHIIRDENELDPIRDYIWQNPRNWRKDSNNTQS